MLNKSKSEFLTLKEEILSMIVCSIENDSCILRECKICKDKTITEENFHLEEDLLFDEITFAIWEKNDFVKKTCALDVYLKELNSCSNTMSKHRGIKELQQCEIKSEKEDRLSSKNHLILHRDFAENWTTIQQDSIQWD